MKNIEITILFVLLSVSFLECKKDVSNKEAALPHADSTYEANVPPYTQAENSKIVAGKTPSLYRVVKFDVPFTIYADLKGNGKLHKIEISQKSYRRAETSGDKNSALVHIKVYDKNKVVFEFKKRSSPILYTQVVRFPVDESDMHRDVVFFIVEPSDYYLNILCWESRIGRSEKTATAMLEGYVFKGEYRYIETDIETNTVYG